MGRIAHPERALCPLRRVGARCADVVRTLVMREARYGQRDTRCAWFRLTPVVPARVVPVWSAHAGGNPSELDRSAEHAHAADRFAREIVGILALSYAARSRRLMGRPVGGGCGSVLSARSCWNARALCSIANEMSSRMPIAPQRHRAMLYRVPIAIAHAHLTASSSRHACSCAKRSRACSSRRNVVVLCSLACQTLSRMLISA